MFRLSPDKSLEIDKTGAPTERDVAAATLVILLDAAYIDADFASSEYRELVRAMNREFQFTDEQVGELAELADIMRKQPLHLEKALKTINEHFDDQQRMNVMTQVWNVMLGDGDADEAETKYAAKIRSRLNLSLEQGVRARQLAEKKAKIQ